LKKKNGRIVGDWATTRDKSAEDKPGGQKREGRIESGFPEICHTNAGVPTEEEGKGGGSRVRNSRWRKFGRGGGSEKRGSHAKSDRGGGSETKGGHSFSRAGMKKGKTGPKKPPVKRGSWVVCRRDQGQTFLKRGRTPQPSTWRGEQKTALRRPGRGVKKPTRKT